MPFWLLVLIIVTLIALCWSGGWGIYRGVPGYGWSGGLLGILGIILLVVLVILFMQGAPTTVTR